jgi:hypothetical protein
MAPRRDPIRFASGDPLGSDRDDASHNRRRKAECAKLNPGDTVNIPPDTMGPAPHCRQLSIKDTPGMPLTKSFGKLLYERATAEPAFAEAP